jgi:hypothetical protein
MPIKTNDSKFLISVNFPEIKNLNSKFFYNFFVFNEKTDGTGGVRVRLKNSKSRKSNNKLENDRELAKKLADTKLPRYIELSFENTDLFISKLNTNNVSLDFSQNISNFETPAYIDNIIKNNSSNQIVEFINLEDNISTPSDLIFNFDDSKSLKRVSDKLNFLSKINSNFLEKIVDLVLVDKIYNSYDKALEKINVLVNQNLSNIIVLDDINKLPNFVDPFDLLRKNKINCILDINGISKMLSSNSARTDANSIDLKDLVKNLSFGFVNANDESHITPTIKTIYLENSNNFNSIENFGIKQIGFLIIKIAKNENKIKVSNELIFQSTPPNLKNISYIDDQIKYGYEYTYSIRSVYLLKHLLIDENVPKIAYSIFASNDSNVTTAEAVTYEVGNFNYVYYEYDYVDGGLKINWQLIDKKNIVKYIQIFRRSSIYEPFTLIGELDFDDSEIKTPRKENINPELSLKTKKDQSNNSYVKPTQFIDRNFKKNSKYIYAIAAVSAHAFSSNYSQQTEISFDIYKNKLNFKIISEGGAPKQYPNFYIDPTLDDNIFVRSFTVDSMKTSNYNKFNIYLDPDALKYTSYINQTDNNSIYDNVKTFDQNSKYSLQLINLDRQLSDSLEIEIKK